MSFLHPQLDRAFGYLSSLPPTARRSKQGLVFPLTSQKMPSRVLITQSSLSCLGESNCLKFWVSFLSLWCAEDLPGLGEGGSWIGGSSWLSLHPGDRVHCHTSPLSLPLFPGRWLMLMRPYSGTWAPWGPINFTLLQLPGTSELNPDQLALPRCLVASLASLSFNYSLFHFYF